MMNFKETMTAIPKLHKTNLVPCLMGHTGIGKTELVEQYAKNNELDLVVIHVAQLEPSDFVGLYKIVDERTTNCPPNWLPYKSGYNKTEVGKNKENLGEVVARFETGVINPNGGIIFLDEVNRGHEDIRQALYQLLTKKKIHTYSLPDKYNLVAAANPSKGYETYDFDKALVNRFAFIKFQPEFEETMEYLENKHGRNPLAGWLKSDKKLVDYGMDDFEIDDMTFTPRTIDNAMILYKEIEKDGKVFQRKCLESIMKKEIVQSFLSYLEEIKFVNFKDVLKGDKKDKVDELINTKRLDVLSTITLDMADFFSDYKIGKGKEFVKKTTEKEAISNLTEYLLKIPAELDMVFLDALKSYDQKDCVLVDENLKTKLKAKLGTYKKLF